MFDYLRFRKIWFLTPTIQVVLIVSLYFIQVYIAYLSYLKTGLIFNYPLFCYATVIFAPIYEEIIFRGFIFHIFLKNFQLFQAIVFSSLLFGLWHLKNIFFLNTYVLAKQIIYTGLIFGPIMALITHKTKNIWPGVILHFLNNIICFLIL